MAIITLTSDLGLRDHYVAMLKGKLLTELPDATLVDISHEISSFNIQQAAFILRNTYPYFPENTIHLINVFAEKRKQIKCIIALYEGHYFAGVDNGLFSLIFDKQPEIIVEVEYDYQKISNFVVKDVLCKPICALAQSGSLQGCGRIIQALEPKVFLKSPDSESFLKGTIVYIDKFGNAISNITKEKYLKKISDKTATVYCKGAGSFGDISEHYSDVRLGEKLCLFNSNGFLEFAIHQGNAASLLGIHLEDSVQIEFE